MGSHTKNRRRALRARRSDSQSELGEHAYYFDTVNDLERYVPRSTVKPASRAVSVNQYHIHSPARKTSFASSITTAYLRCTQVLLEIIGFWTPEYLREKVIRLERFRDQAKILLAIAESVDDAIPDLGIARVSFKTILRPKQVLEQLEKMSA